SKTWPEASSIPDPRLTLVMERRRRRRDHAANLQEARMDKTRKLWIALGALLAIAFGVLLWAGSEIFREAPPMPERVVAEDGTVVFTREDILTGRRVWQSMGGMQLGSIWCHGAYVAPDW